MAPTARSSGGAIGVGGAEEEKEKGIVYIKLIIIDNLYLSPHNQPLTKCHHRKGYFIIMLPSNTLGNFLLRNSEVIINIKCIECQMFCTLQQKAF